MTTKNSFKVLLIIGMCAGAYANNAVAESDGSALVNNSGPVVSVPEPSTLSLLLAGVIGVAAVRLFKRKK